MNTGILNLKQSTLNVITAMFVIFARTSVVVSAIIFPISGAVEGRTRTWISGASSHQMLLTWHTP